MRDRWTELGRRIECPSLGAHFRTLDAAYCEAHRSYHTWRHVVECLDVWVRCTEEALYPDELEFAIWLHDIRYSPLRSDNEERSAETAVEWLEGCSPQPLDPRRVRGLVLATRHPASPASPDEALIQDIDLYILGAPPARYAEYELQIRREYRLVPGPVFRRRRAHLLRTLLDSPSLFNTAWFQDRYEAVARQNVASALRDLQ